MPGHTYLTCRQPSREMDVALDAAVLQVRAIHARKGALFKNGL